MAELSRKGQRRRQEIIEAAFTAFARGGFRSATTLDIAREVGLSEPGLLHYFPTKTDLLLAVLQEREERAGALMAGKRAAGHDYLTGFIEVLRANAKEPELTRLFTVLSAESIADDHPAHAWFVARYRRLVDEAAGALGPAAGVDAETVARWLIALADGMRLQWLLDPAVDRVAAVSQLAGLLTALGATRKDETE